MKHNINQLPFFCFFSLQLYIGKIPNDIYEDELMFIFGQIGPVYKFRLMMNFSGLTRGFGYLLYIHKSDAIQAVQKLNGYLIRPNQRLVAKRSTNNCSINILYCAFHLTDHFIVENIKALTDPRVVIHI